MSCSALKLSKDADKNKNRGKEESFSPLSYNINNSEKLSPLENAVLNNDYKTAKLLLQSEIDVSELFDGHTSPLSVACKLGNLKMCKLLIKFKANVDVKHPDGAPILHTAVTQGRYDIAKLLLENKADVNVMFYDISPISIACNCGNLKMCKFLVSFGADVNLKKQDGTSPLHLAVRGINHKLVEFILEAGGDVNSKTKDNITPLLAAAKYGDGDVQTKICKLLLKFKADPNLSSLEGDFPLYRAVDGGAFKMAELLLMNDADVDKTFKGRTPLYTATKHGDKRLCELLLRFRAGPSIPDVNRKTPLHVATSRNFYEIAFLLLENGAQVNRRNNDGETPLFTAVVKENAKLTQLFLNYGGDIYAKNKNDFAPIDSVRALTKFSFFRERLKKRQSELIKIFHLETLKLEVVLFSKLSSPVELSYFQEKCWREIWEMQKNYIVADLKISYYDVLICQLSQLEPCFRNEGFRSAIKSKSWRKRYPIYEGTIYSKLMACEYRRKLLDELEPVFSEILPSLPPPCSEKILSFLTDDELRTLVCLGSRKKSDCNLTKIIVTVTRSMLHNTK